MSGFDGTVESVNFSNIGVCSYEADPSYSYSAGEAAQEATLLSVSKDEEEIGYAILLPQVTSPEVAGGLTYLEHVWVEEDFRGNRVSSFLIRKAVEQARKEGFDIIGTQAQNERTAKAFCSNFKDSELRFFQKLDDRKDIVDMDATSAINHLVSSRRKQFPTAPYSSLQLKGNNSVSIAATLV